MFLLAGGAAGGLWLESLVGLDNPTVLLTIAITGITVGIVPWEGLLLRWRLRKRKKKPAAEIPLAERDRFAALASQMREDLPVVTDPGHRDCGTKRAYWVHRLWQFGVFPPLAWEDRMWELLMPAYLADADAGDLDAALSRRGYVAKLMIGEVQYDE